MNNNKKNTQVLVTLIICIVSIITLSISLLVAFFIKPGSNDGGINNGKTSFLDRLIDLIKKYLMSDETNSKKEDKDKDIEQ